MPLFIDTETTGKLVFKGTGKNRKVDDKLEIQPHIVQLAYEVTDENEVVLAEVSTLIKPEGWTIPEEATKVHGITTDLCDKFSVPIKRALSMLHGYAELGLMIVAHSLEFDYELLNIECLRAFDRPTPFAPCDKFCTMLGNKDILKIPGQYGDFKWPRLDETYRFYFGRDFEKAHTACADVRACREIFYEQGRRNFLPKDETGNPIYIVAGCPPSEESN
jgi:DNA polymerase-3 subunit epsilon